MEEQKLSFKDKYITPLTKEYKNFIHEMENTPSEIFYRDGERQFTEKELKFMQIYEQKQPKLGKPQIYSVVYDNIKIGGEITEIAGKTLTDKDYLHLFDEGTKNTIEMYLKTNPNTERIKLTPQDNLALAERWQKEINNPTEMSKGMTINQIAEKEANYHSLYNHGMKQTQNLQNMETLTPQEKVQELFNEIKETFSPIEKAFFQRKLENTGPAGGWQLGNFLDHSGITPQEQEKVNSFFAEKVSPIFQKENDNIHRELYNKTELDNDFIKEVNPIFLDVDIKREKEMEQPPKNMEKQQELAEDLLEKVKKDFTPNEQFLISEFARIRNYKPVDIGDEVMDLAMVYQKSENFIDNASISNETINKVNKFLDENVSEVKDKDKVLLSSFVNEMHNDIEFSNQMKEVYKQAEITAWDTEEDLTINTKQNNMETLTPQEKVQELFNEIKETFSPIEKAFFQRKLENTSPAGGWQLGNFLDHSGITPQEQEKVNSFFAEKINPIFQKENYNIHRELYNKTELDNDFIKEVNPIFLDVDIKREKEMEQPQKNMEKQQEQTQPQQEKQFDVAEYLNNQMKYLGFGDNHKEAIQKGIDSKDNSFQIHTTSDKALFGNKAEFAVNFNKSEKGGVFLNSFDAKLTTNKGEERSQNFRLNFTAKEAINLLEGRAVKTELQNKQGEKFNAFVKLNFAEEKNEFGNYKSKLFNENYGVDTGKIVDELKLKFDKPEYRENAIKALEKGNIIKAKFEHEGKEIQGKAFLNVEYKTLNLYDEKMTRLNTNKPLQGLEQDNSHKKNNIRQQNISRSL